MKNNIRRPLAMLLLICMVLTMLPVTALADEAEGKLIASDGWTIINEVAEKYAFGDENSVSISVVGKSLFNGTNRTAKNVFLHGVEEADFEVSVKMEFQPTKNYATAGLIVYHNDDNLFMFTRRYHKKYGNQILGTMGSDENSAVDTEGGLIGTDGKVTDQSAQADVEGQAAVYLKIRKEGSTFACFYSLDGKEWIQHENTYSGLSPLSTWGGFNNVEASELQVGLYVGDSAASETCAATFSDFSIRYLNEEEAEKIPLAFRTTPVEAVSVEPASVELSVYDESTLSAVVAPEDATIKDVVWTSDNEEVVTVDESGKITGVSVGSATITATSKDDPTKAGTCTVTVTAPAAPVTGVKLDKSAETIQIGNTLALTASVEPENANNPEVVWSSSNESIARVDQTGLVTGVYVGTATITVTTVDGGFTASCEVTVEADTTINEKQWSVNSPSGNVQVELKLDDAGKLLYNAANGENKIVEESEIGIVTDLADFSSALLPLGSAVVTEINETYTLTTGKHSEVTNHGNELVLTFKKGSGDSEAHFIVYVRAYDDGYAFRYTVKKADDSTGDLDVFGESSTFVVPAQSTVWSINNKHKSNDTQGGVFCHENTYDEGPIEEVTTTYQQAFPLLYLAPNGQYTLLTEADVYDDTYVASGLHRQEGTTVMQLAIPPQQKARYGAEHVDTQYPFTSPWRVAVSGDLGDIVETDMVENVSDPVEGDYSWAQPGIAAWTWIVGHRVMQSNFEFIKSYVDFAAEMGWTYYIMDDGWQPYDEAIFAATGKYVYSGYYDWFEELVEYANSKGVKLIAWMDVNNYRSDGINGKGELLVDKLDETLADFAAHGISGIKIDFFRYDDQDTIDVYDGVYQLCAKHKLVANIHGSNEPTGERRTYPNLINREGVKGDEYKTLDSTQMNILPFTRAVVGPTDMTPRLTGSGNTTGQRVAMYILYECGMTSMASSIEEYRVHPSYSLLKGLPAAWDDTKFIDGYPGDYTTIARRSGENWYVAAITNDEARTAVIPLDFLEEGKVYTAAIYRDGDSSEEMIVEQQNVTSADTLNVALAANGGCSVKIVEKQQIDSVSVDEEVVLKVGESATLEAAVLPESMADTALIWSSSDGSVASVANGTVTAKALGVAIVTVSAAGNADAKATCVVRVEGDKYLPADGWEIVAPSASAPTQLHEDDPNTITIPMTAGDINKNGDTQNVWVREPESSEFDITVKVGGEQMDGNYQIAGIMAYANATNVVNMTRRYHSKKAINGSSNLLCLATWNSSWTEYYVEDTQPDKPVYLRLVKNGNEFTGYYKYEGDEDWTQVANTITNASVGESETLRIGVRAGYGSGSSGNDVIFESFTENGTLIPFTMKKTVLDVSAVGKVASVDTLVGTAFEALGLSETVTVYLDNGSKAEVPVIWNAEDYDAALLGQQTVTGTLDLTDVENIVNPDDLTVSVSVTVKEEEKIEPDHTEICPSKDFTDVNVTEWYHDAIDYVLSKGIMNGNGDGTFAPVGHLTRAELVQILYNMEGRPEHKDAASFPDVAADDWFYDAVTWAAENGVVLGHDNGTFAPDDNVTREDMVTILWRYAGEPEATSDEITFADVALIADYAQAPVAWAVEKQVVIGVGDNMFNPDGFSERAEIAQLMMNYCEKAAQ